MRTLGPRRGCVLGGCPGSDQPGEAGDKRASVDKGCVGLAQLDREEQPTLPAPSSLRAEMLKKISHGIIDHNLVCFEAFGGDRGLAAESRAV